MMPLPKMKLPVPDRELAIDLRQSAGHVQGGAAEDAEEVRVEFNCDRSGVDRELHRTRRVLV